MRLLAAMRALAWTNVAVHLAGLAFAATAIRPGTPAVPAAERAAYLAARPLGWTLGWATWMACAMALVALLAVIATMRPSPAAQVAVVLAAAGAAVDLACDAVYITALPELAAAGPTPLFLAAERALAVAGQVAANGLYSIAVLLVTLDVGRRHRLTLVLGAATFAAGMALAGAGFSGDTTALAISAGATILCYCGWTLAVSHALRALAPG
jgi:hypothetical protein